MPRVPYCFLTIRGDDDGGRVNQHAYGVLYGFIVPADDPDPTALNAVPITIFAEEETAPETLSDLRDFRREVGHPRGQKHQLSRIAVALSLEEECMFVPFHGNDFIPYELDLCDPDTGRQTTQPVLLRSR